MKKINFIIKFPVLLFLTGCSIPQLGFFQVEPFVKPFSSEIRHPLNLVLLNDVKDSIAVEGEGIKKMTVTDFRTSFGESMRNTLEKNFEVVNILDSKPDTGLSLVIYRIKPFWKLNSQYSSTYGTSGYIHSSTKSLISSAFQFESSLFYNNEKLQNADATVYSDDQMSTVDQAHAVFKSGLTKACETIINEIFKDEVVKKIQTY